MRIFSSIILALALVATGAFAAEPDFIIVGTKSSSPAPTPTKMIVVEPVSTVHPLGGPGWHSHTCRVCGTTWAHRDNSRNASHNCPSCGRPEYIQNPRGGTTTKQVIWQ